jgi:hypothetical protein
MICRQISALRDTISRRFSLGLWFDPAVITVIAAPAQSEKSPAHIQVA